MAANLSSVEVRKMRCPKCHKQKVWKSGYIATKSKGRVLRLKCQMCAHSWNYDPPKPRKPKVQKAGS